MTRQLVSGVDLALKSPILRMLENLGMSAVSLFMNHRGFRLRILGYVVVLAGTKGVRSLTAMLLLAVFATPLAAAQDSPEYAPNVVVVQFAPSAAVANKTGATGLQEFDRRAARYAVHLIERVYPFLDHVEPTPKTRRNLEALRRTFYVRFAASAAPNHVADALAAVRGVAYAEPVLVHRTEALETPVRVDPDDPRFGDQSEIQMMRLPEAWDVVKGEDGSPRVVIAIVDGGGEWRHEDLRANVWTNPDEIAGNGVDDDQNGFVDDVRGVNFANGDPSDNDPTGLPETPSNANHGTATSGLAGAVTDNGVGIAGASWNVEIMHINAGCGGAVADGLVCHGYQGVLYAAANGADIINTSWDGLAGTDGEFRFIDQSLNLATDMGALVVASVGNEGRSTDLLRNYPARHPRVLSVGATEKATRRLAGFSNYGGLVNVFAPGQDILTTGSGNAYVLLSGTSYSAPLVAGVAALVKTEFPTLGPDALREHIRLTSENIDAQNPALAGQLGRGFVNARTAVQAPALPAVRLERWSWTDDDGDGQIASGDVVTVTATVVNYLSDARRLTVGLMGAEPYSFIDLTRAEADVGRLASGDSAEVRLRFAVAANAPDNQQVRFYTRIRDGAFEDGPDLLSFRVNRSLDEVHHGLSAFYTATGGDNWTRNDNWDIARIPSEAELATWFGVGLSDEGWLVDLSLRENNLTGALPPELGSLPHLQVLNLRGNAVTGPIPTELASLSQLEELDLRYNTLTGPIPPELGSLQQVKRLILRGNSLTGPIPSELGSLPKLEWLILDSNSLTGSIPPELGHLPRLTQLHLGDDQLTGSIPSELGRLAQLRVLNLSGTSITGPIPPELGGLAQLRELHLRNNSSLTGPIPPELGGLTQLRVLSLFGNSLTGPIPPEIGGLTQLEKVLLLSNSLTGSIPPEIGNLAQLQWLDLRFNSLTGPIPPEVGNLTQLTSLELDDNSLTGPIPPEIGNLSQLTRLWLNNNSLSGHIPPEIGGLAQLQELELRHNSLTGPLPPEIGHLTQLHRLLLEDNSLTGPLPPEIGRLGQVEWLFLDDNSLTGPIPPEIGGLAQLQELKLRRNSLTGPLPPELGNLAQLRRLQLGNNSVTGAIPAELGNLAQLVELDLDHNSLTGPIPPEIGRLANLEQLFLRSNQLTGSIPSELGSLSQLGELAMWNNQLTGSIPPELGSLPRLYRLYLQDNSLTGPIPPELGSLAQLRLLYLNNNSLTGLVPSELGNLAQLQELHLQGNALTGTLPRSLMQLDNLRTFYFGDQQLCAPQDDEFQMWLGSIQEVIGPTCAELHFAGTIADQSFPRAQPIAPLVLPEATGGAPPIGYTLTPALPAGLSFDASSRTISGTPTEVTAAPIPYTYKATDSNGSADSLQFSIAVYSPVAAEQESVPESFAVRGNFPNPFRQSTRIVVDLPWPARVTVEVVDLTGRRIHSVPAVDLAAGWERGIDIHGGTLSSGLYLYRLVATSPEGNSLHVGRLVLLR